MRWNGASNVVESRFTQYAYGFIDVPNDKREVNRVSKVSLLARTGLILTVLSGLSDWPTQRGFVHTGLVFVLGALYLTTIPDSRATLAGRVVIYGLGILGVGAELWYFLG